MPRGYPKKKTFAERFAELPPMGSEAAQIESYKQGVKAGLNDPNHTAELTTLELLARLVVQQIERIKEKRNDA